MSPYAGRIDEFRMSSSARSGDWIATAYNNQSAPATFVSVAAEETLSNAVNYKFTGACLSNSLVTLYNGTTQMLPSVVCNEGVYSIVPKIEPGEHTITACQSNRK